MTPLEQTEDTLRQRQLTEPTGAWTEARLDLPPWNIRVALGRDRQGGWRFRYWLDGHRLEREPLQTLLCTNTLCPQRQSAHRQWEAFVAPRRSARPTSPPVFVHRLAEEVEMTGPDGQTWTARSARLRVQIDCPQAAHPSRVVTVDAWDLFRDGRCVAGGLQDGQPLLRTLDDVRAWIASACPAPIAA